MISVHALERAGANTRHGAVNVTSCMQRRRPCFAGLKVTRPKVGTLTSPPVRYAADCFAPLTDAELKEWGL